MGCKPFAGRCHLHEWQGQIERWQRDKDLWRDGPCLGVAAGRALFRGTTWLIASLADVLPTEPGTRPFHTATVALAHSGRISNAGAGQVVAIDDAGIGHSCRLGLWGTVAPRRCPHQSERRENQPDYRAFRCHASCLPEVTIASCVRRLPLAALAYREWYGRSRAISSADGLRVLPSPESLELVIPMRLEPCGAVATGVVRTRCVSCRGPIRHTVSMRRIGLRATCQQQRHAGEDTCHCHTDQYPSHV